MAQKRGGTKRQGRARRVLDGRQRGHRRRRRVRGGGLPRQGRGRHPHGGEGVRLHGLFDLSHARARRHAGQGGRAALGTSEPTVSRRLAKVRDKLRDSPRGGHHDVLLHRRGTGRGGAKRTGPRSQRRTQSGPTKRSSTRRSPRSTTSRWSCAASTRPRASTDSPKGTRHERSAVLLIILACRSPSPLGVFSSSISSSPPSRASPSCFKHLWRSSAGDRSMTPSAGRRVVTASSWCRSPSSTCFGPLVGLAHYGKAIQAARSATPSCASTASRSGIPSAPGPGRDHRGHREALAAGRRLCGPTARTCRAGERVSSRATRSSARWPGAARAASCMSRSRTPSSVRRSRAPGAPTSGRWSSSPSASGRLELPQIVRESQSLEAAKRLGLVLDHELTKERFYYVMRVRAGPVAGRS
jgi:hypothetical protein